MEEEKLSWILLQTFFLSSTNHGVIEQALDDTDVLLSDIDISGQDPLQNKADQKKKKPVFLILQQNNLPLNYLKCMKIQGTEFLARETWICISTALMQSLLYTKLENNSASVERQMWFWTRTRIWIVISVHLLTAYPARSILCHNHLCYSHYCLQKNIW